MKDIPVFGKTDLFAGLCRNADLGRPVRPSWFLHGGGAPVTADVLRTPRRGTPSSTRNQRTCTRRRHEKPCLRSGDASFTRSEDPYTSILTMHRVKARWWGASGDIAVGQTCVSGRNQHRDHRKRTECGSSRVVALAREAARHVRKGRRSRPPSLRGSRARVWLLARRCMLQKSAGERLVSNKLGKRAPKRAVRVE